MPPQTLMLALIALLVHAVNGEADCSKPPRMTNVKTCCKIPEPNWAGFKANCNAPNLPNARGPNPCFLECIFNQSRSLDGEDLNMGNVRIMLTTLFNGNQDFVEAYALGFEKCQPLIKQRISDFKAKKKGVMPKASNCQLIGTFYAMCAHKMVFIGCPATAWTSSSECEAAKEYASTCEPRMGGPGGQRGESGLKRGRRDVSSTEMPMDADQMSDDQTQQLPGGRGQGQRRGGQRWGGGGGAGGGGGYGVGGGYGSRRGQGMGQRQGMGSEPGTMGQQQGQAWPSQRRGQGMRQGMGPNAQGQPMPMGQGMQQRPMGQQGMGQGMGQGMRQGQQRKGRRRMGQGQGQGQTQDPNNTENIAQEPTQSRRKRDLNEVEILDFFESWDLS